MKKNLAISVLVLFVTSWAAQLYGAQWRALKLSKKRSQSLAKELKSALQKRWRKRLIDISVTLKNPRIVTNGKKYHLLADGGLIDVKKGTIGHLPITGSIELGTIGLDYRPLGLGKVKVVKASTIKPSVKITLEQLDRLLGKSGFVNTKVAWNESSNRILMTGERPVRFFIFRLRPKFRVTGRFTIEDKFILRLDKVRIKVAGILGFLAKLATTRMEKRATKRIDVRKDYRKLAKDNIYFAGGDIELFDGEKSILRFEFPPHPALKKLD